MTKFAPEIEAAISQAVRETGISEARLRALIQIESGGRANAQTGSYLGALQLSQAEFRRYGGSGNIFDPVANIVTGARKLQAEAAALERDLGRPPTTNELYMVHQQGEGGAASHRARPDAPAWQNMYATAEGQAKGPEWAKRAIWGNVPTDMRAQFPGGVDGLTSRQFMDLWGQKVARFGGGTAPAAAQTQYVAPPEEGKIYFEPDQSARPIRKDGNAGQITGNVTVNGSTYRWASGGTGRGALPMGEYQAAPMMTGQQRAAAGYSYTRDAFPLSDTADIVPGDPQRRGLLVHSLNGAPGTAGCIGIDGQFHAFSKDFTAEMAAKQGLTPAWSDGKNVVVGKAPVGMEVTMANAQDGPGTNQTQTPATTSPRPSSPIATSSTQPSFGGGAMGGDTSSAALHAASAFFSDTAQRQKEQEAESARQMKLAQAARPDAPGPSPMLAAPRLPNVDIRQLLNVLKARGVATDGTPQTLGSGARSILGT